MVSLRLNGSGRTSVISSGRKHQRDLKIEAKSSCSAGASALQPSIAAASCSVTCRSVGSPSPSTIGLSAALCDA
eukprot:scaffold20823_cov91-Isochrysis_galbana.AAC.2